MPKRNLNSIRRWHSINLFPRINSVTIVQDDPPYRPIGRMIELVWLGWIIDVVIPIKAKWKAWNMGYAGPRWSRRQKKWKWGKEL